jgi:hypothetical protein
METRVRSLGIEYNGAAVVAKSKAIPITGLGGLQSCEMLRIPHSLDNRFTDGGKVVRPMHRPQFTPQKHDYVSISGTLKHKK